MRPSRKKLYRRLEGMVGNTPLTELRNLEVPNNNKIFAKEEYRNPTGSHYDRIILELLRGLEQEGKFGEGDLLMDTTTGNSGASFAWLCRALRFRCEVIIPRDMPAPRIAQIRSYGAAVDYSEGGRYIEGLIERLGVRMGDTRREVHVPDHAGNTVYPPAAMRALGAEIVEDVQKHGYPNLDYFVCALGNGASTYAGEPLRASFGTRTIGVEPIESPTLFLRKFSHDDFFDRYGVAAEQRSHELIGTGPGEVAFPFPLFNATLPEIEDIKLVKKEQWEPMMTTLADVEGQHVGRTSAACVWGALELAEHVTDSAIVVLCYDQAWKYLRFAADDDAEPAQDDERSLDMV